MKTLNPRLLVESILEGVDLVEHQLGRALDERCQQYTTDQGKEHWQRVMANWIITKHVMNGQIEKLLGLIDTANRADLARMTAELQELASCL